MRRVDARALWHLRLLFPLIMICSVVSPDREKQLEDVQIFFSDKKKTFISCHGQNEVGFHDFCYFSGHKCWMHLIEFHPDFPLGTFYEVKTKFSAIVRTTFLSHVVFFLRLEEMEPHSNPQAGKTIKSGLPPLKKTVKGVPHLLWEQKCPHLCQKFNTLHEYMHFRVF